MAGIGGALSIAQFLANLWGGTEKSAETKEDRARIAANQDTAMSNLDALKSMVMGSSSKAGKNGVMQAGTGLTGMSEKFTKEYDALRELSTSRANQIKDSSNAGFTAMADDQIKSLIANLGGVKGEFDAKAGALDSAYGARTDKLMGMLKGLGTQEKKDAMSRNTALSNLASRSATARGLGGTSVLTSARSGVAREGEAEQRRINERLQGQALNTYGAASGDQLASRRAMGLAGTELGRSNALSQSALSSSLRTQQENNATEISKWAANNNDMISTAMLNASQQAQLMPIQANMDMTKFQEGTRVGMSAPPGVLPIGTVIGSALQGPMDYWSNQQAIAAQKAAQKDAAQSNMFGSLIGAGSNIAGASIGAYGVSQMKPPNIYMGV